MRVADLDGRTVAEALTLLGARDAPTHRAAAARQLREILEGHRTVRDLLEAAPDAGRDAFVALATEGPARVSDVADRGWSGRGNLPFPLDWLQRRALVAPDANGRVHAVDEARRAYLAPTLDLQAAAEPDSESEPDPAPESAPEEAGVAPGGATDTAPPSEAIVHPARSVVVAAPETIDRLCSDDELGLEAISDTVAIGDADAEAVRAALRRAGVRLLGEEAVVVDAHAPALPTAPERAVGPKQVRSLLDRAVEQRRQVWLRYHTSSRGGATTERVVDPWSLAEDLLVGWCHLRRDERTFAVGRIGEAVLLADEIASTPD
ncbi:MAG: hypothetical protein BRC31_06805 [Actinobacteria bacterium QS_5_72_10]|nr:MAG: hypothetical protein BRC31_06805 [Actinobacteria bacterium QS_5_72_10]